MLQDFKCWLEEGSLHEPLKTHKESDEKDGANYPAKKHHRTFNEVEISRCFPCDRCRKKSVRYQCTNCDQGYCTDC